MVKIRSPREITDQLDRWVEQGRRLLPLTRGGDGRKRVKPVKPRKPQPLPKTFQFTPTIPTTPGPTGEDVRWKPTPGFIPSTPQFQPIAPPIREPPQEMTIVTMEEDEMQREIEELLDQLPTEGEQELAYMTLQDENRQGPQNQTLENVLARMGARRP